MVFFFLIGNYFWEIVKFYLDVFRVSLDTKMIGILTTKKSYNLTGAPASLSIKKYSYIKSLPTSRNFNGQNN